MSARTKCIAQCKNEIPPASLEYRWQFSLRRLISTARGWPPLSSVSSSTCLLANDPPTVYIKLPAELDTRHAIPARREYPPPLPVHFLSSSVLIRLRPLFLYISARRVPLYLYCRVYTPHDRFIFPFICRIAPPTLFALLRIHAFLSALIIRVVVYPPRHLPFSMYPDKVMNTSSIFRSTYPTSFQTLIYRPEYL